MLKPWLSLLRRWQNSLPLRWRLIAAFVYLALLTMAVVGIYVDNVTRSLINRAARDDLAKASSRTALQIDSYLASQLDSIRTEAQQPYLVDYLKIPPDLRANSIQEINARQVLVIFSRKDPVFINSYALLDERGFNLLDTEERHIGDDESEFEYFITPFAQGLPFISTILFKNNEKSFYISAPVRNEHGAIIGVLRAEYDAVVLQAMLVSILPEKGTGNFISIIDAQTYVRLADTGGINNLYKSLAELSAADVSLLQAQKRLPPGAPAKFSQPTPDFVAGIEHLPQTPFFEAYSDSISADALITGISLQSVAWLVLEGRSQEILAQPIVAQRRAASLFTLFILSLAVLLAIIMSLVIAKPVVDLTAVARRIADGDLNASAPVHSDDEVGALAQAFNSMTVKLRETLAGLESELRERQNTAIILQKNEMEMRLTNEFLRSIMDSPKGVIIFSLNRNYCYTTFTHSHAETMKNIWGADIEIGVSMLTAIHSPADREKAKSNFDRALLGEAFTIQEEYGDEKLLRTWWEDRYSPVYDEHHQITGLTVVVIDITERKRMEVEILESEERFRKVFHSSPVAICIISLEGGRFLDANYAYWELSGLNPAAAVNHDPFDFEILNQPEDRDRFIQRLRQKRSIYDADYLFKNVHGERIPTLAFYELIQLGGEECVLSMFYDMSEQKRTLEALQVAHKESEILRENLASIVSTLEFEEIVRLILAQIKQVIPYDTASVWRYEDDVQIIIAGVDLPPEIKIPGTSLVVDENNSAYPILDGRAPFVLCNNVQEELPDFKSPHDYIHSWLAIPLKTRGRIIGLIALDGKKRDQFTHRHAELAVMYANQVAVALANASLFSELQSELNLRENLIKELEQKSAEAETLRESLANVVGTFELSEIILRILDQIKLVVPYDSASIWRLQGNRQILLGERNLPPELLQAGLEFELDANNHAMPIFRGERAYMISENVQAEFPRFAEPPHNYIHSWLGVPLKVRGNIVGLIALDGRRAGQFNEHHAHLAVTFANQVAIALENSRLFTDLQAELRKQTALRSASLSISSSLHLDQVLHEICKQICLVNQGTSAYIAVYEENYSGYRTVAEYVTADANADEAVSDMGVIYYKTQGAWLFDEVPDMEYKIIRAGDEDLSPWSLQMLEVYRGKSILIIPLYVQGRLLGHTELWDSRTRREFTKDDISFCRTLSQQAAIAIANANLFEQLQNELRERKNLIAELEAKNAELERFTYTVSHDLKSPLFTIRGFLGYLAQDAVAGDQARLQNDIQRITDATEKMQRLLNELLELSRIGRLKNESTNIPFGELVREALEITHGRITARDIVIQVPEDLPVVFGDHPRLLEVLQNLIDNAAKFMGNQPNPQITIGTAGVENGNLIFFVRDNGIGIPAEHHERIFGLFNKLDVKAEGTGIGLALVKRIIEVHNGRIWVNSEVGQGATFYFILPGGRG